MDGDDHLVGYRLGDAHEHDHCGLCLPHSTSRSGPETGLPYHTAPEPRFYAARLEPGRVFSPDRPLLGPPEPDGPAARRRAGGHLPHPLLQA
jgi:hypothetical protein